MSPMGKTQRPEPFHPDNDITLNVFDQQPGGREGVQFSLSPEGETGTPEAGCSWSSVRRDLIAAEALEVEGLPGGECD